MRQCIVGVWRGIARALAAVAVGLMLLPLVSGAGVVRVLTLNAEWFPGRRPEAAPAEQARHMVAMQRMLFEVNPDIWLVQEVQRAEALPLAFAVLPDVSLYTVSAFPEDRHQLAIAGRLPLREARTHKWRVPDADAPPPRGVAFSAVDLPDGRVLLLFTLHMKSNFTGYEDYDPVMNVALREAEAGLFVDYVAAVRAEFADQAVAGVLLGGDLNVLYPRSIFRGERTLSILETAGFEHLGGYGVDHFLGMGLGRPGFRVLMEYNVSDHRGLLLELELPEGTAVRRAARLEPGDVAALAGEVRTNVNTAGPDELRSLPGIGPVLAQRIIDNRPFDSVPQLVEVCGIGPVTLSIMAPHMKIAPPPEVDGGDVRE